MSTFSTSFSLPSGFVELSPQTLAQRRAIEAELLGLFARYGFVEVDVASLEYEPLYEPSRMGHELFHHLICGRISERRDFNLDGRRSSVRAVVLRPDFIAPLARRFITEALSGGWPRYLPVRWSFAGQVFQNVQAQGGRRREFRQLGAAVIGVEHRLANLEVLNLVVDAAERLSLRGWELRLGHAGLYDALLGAIGVPQNVRGMVSSAFKSYVRSHHRAQANPGAFLSWAEKSAPQTSKRLREVRLRDRQVKAIMDLAEVGGPFEQVQQALEGYRAHAQVERLLETLRWHADELFARRGVRPVIDPAVRGNAAYYDGLTFELHAKVQGQPIKLGSGGRHAHELYDWILRQARATQSLRVDGAAAELGERRDRLTGVGFVFGLERLLMALGAPEEAPSLDVFVAIQRRTEPKALKRTEPKALERTEPEALAEAAARFAGRVRARGRSAVAHLPRGDGQDGLREQLGRAKHLGARFTVIFGEAEHAEGKVAVKRMSDGAQTVHPLEEAEALLCSENA